LAVPAVALVPGWIAPPLPPPPGPPAPGPPDAPLASVPPPPPPPANVVLDGLDVGLPKSFALPFPPACPSLLFDVVPAPPAPPPPEPPKLAVPDWGFAPPAFPKPKVPESPGWLDWVEAPPVPFVPLPG